MAKIINNYSELKENPAYELMYEEYLDEVKSSGIVLRHKKSGARVCVLSNDDENKMFCAAFRTPPKDSTGVAHIIEHTVLCGSKNYPSRDPFMQLVKGSLNTFLNAMTYPDKTMYPVASCNSQDFINLMNVYMDAVFYPNIYKYRQIFMQEGWHYELENADDDLTVNGVVYSEMKGAVSSPDRAVWEEISYALYPDTAYGVNSGGDPEVIPSLTYEEYIAFHQKYYHPSNSYIFIYGDCDMDERLEWMDKNYLSSFNEIKVDSEVSLQPRFGENEPKRVEAKYSVGSEDDTDGKAFLAYAALGGSNLDVLECRAWAVLSGVLLNSDGAPLKKALIDAGIGEDVWGGYDSHMIEDSFAVIAKNADEKDAERFYQIIIDTLRNEVENGISEKAILAALNRREFNFREADYGGYPKGLDYAANILQSWLYDENGAFTYMHTLADYAELKKRIGTGYYEDLVRKYILESDHSILLKLIPERGLVDQKEEELKEKLAAYKASLSDAEIAKIIEDTRLLDEYQSHEPTEEELSCIPSLTRHDIPRETVPLSNTECEVGGCRAVRHEIESNGITYLDIYFDIGKVPQKYVPYVGLLENILGRIDTAEHTYEDLAIDLKLNTGSLSFGHHTPRKYGTIDEYRPLYGVFTRVLADRVDYAMKTAAEIITTSKFEDTKRIKNIIAELKSDKQREIMTAGNGVAAARARSYFSRLECYNQQLGGIDFYLFLCDIMDNFDERAAELSEDLRLVTEYIFNPENITVSITADEAGYKAAEEAVPVLCARLAEISHASLGEHDEYVPTKKNEAILIPSQVQYVARAGNLINAGLEYKAYYQVVKTAVNIDYLYQQIRVKGGAYGCGCVFGADSGNVHFSSYRDPRLAETDEVYRGTGDFVRNVKFDESELEKFIVGTFSAYERPMSPAGRAHRSIDAYFMGKTYDDILRERGQMLGITEEQFRSAAEVYDKICEQGYICAVGNEKKLKENADMFDNLITIK